MKNFKLTVFLLLVFLSNAFAQQTVEVTGIVTDENNEPLIGVNITVSDVPGLGTITDINGAYKIKVKEYSKLIFSYVGFEPVEVLVKEDQHVINVTMKESVTLLIDEVVVTATGAQK